MRENQILSEDNAQIGQNTARLAWRLDEIAGSTGLSIPFLRKEIKNHNLKAKKRGRCVIVMDCDLQIYLESE